jgi:hypothetical protein
MVLRWSFTILALTLGIASCMPERKLVPVTTRVGPAGGRVVSESGIAVDIPEGALSSEIPITIASAYGLPPGSLIEAEIGPSGTEFAKPVTLTFPYDGSTTNAGELKVMTVSDGQWIALPDWSRNLEAKTISGTTTHLSPYGLVASAETCGNQLDDDGDELVDCDDPMCVADALCVDQPDGGSGDEDAGVVGRKCNFDHQCDTGESCIDGHCAPTPATEDGGTAPDGGDVPDAGTTDDGGSSPDAGQVICHNNNQCSTGEACVDGQCVTVTDGGVLSCESDAECPTGLHCRGFQCK